MNLQDIWIGCLHRNPISDGFPYSHHSLIGFSVTLLTLFANSRTAIRRALAGEGSRSRPQFLAGFRASSDPAVDFANSVRCYSDPLLGPRELRALRDPVQALEEVA